MCRLLRKTVLECTAAAVLLLLIGCGAKQGAVPPGLPEADKFLFDRGIEALEQTKWLTAREYLRQVVENYPQSTYRPDAKLGVGDTYLGEGTRESLVLAINEFREFLTFYPTHRRADYAQYKLGLAHFKQMLRPERDQSETREAIKEFEVFLERYPNSSLMSEVRGKLRESRDRLSDAEFRVGFFYYRSEWYPGALDRFRGILKSDPEYSRRDGVYFYLAETLFKNNKQAEALPYYERLVNEFESSEYLAETRKRIDALKLASTSR